MADAGLSINAAEIRVRGIHITLIKHDEENPSKPACLLRDSGRASFWPAEGSVKDALAVVVESAE